jgi:DNA-binding LytR/AlgR family response regulator
MNGLKQFNDTLLFRIDFLQRKIGKYEVADLNHSIEFISEKKDEIIHLLIVNILFFKAADNYVEIHSLEDEQVKKKLIRNTLRNIEIQIKPFKNFVRCHRNCIVNIDHVENSTTFCKDHTLIIKGHHDKIPVSRQFLLKINEAL